MISLFKSRHRSNPGRDHCCPFTGRRSSSLALYHDHSTMRLRGWIDGRKNLIIDRVALVDLETHTRCQRNLRDARLELRGDSETVAFQRWTLYLIRLNNWIVTAEEHRLRTRANATRRIYRQFFDADLPNRIILKSPSCAASSKTVSSIHELDATIR